jgi:hypothetical protein
MVLGWSLRRRECNIKKMKLNITDKIFIEAYQELAKRQMLLKNLNMHRKLRLISFSILLFVCSGRLILWVLGLRDWEAADIIVFFVAQTTCIFLLSSDIKIKVLLLCDELKKDSTD